MPNVFEPLTKQEKEAIIRRNKEITKEMNEVLNDPDEEVVKELDPHTLDDPSFVASYRIASEMKEIKAKQAQMLDFILGDNDYHNLADKKWLIHAIKTENTPEATVYNQNLIKDYKKNPDKLKAYLFKKVTTFNPVKLMLLKDDKAKLLEFYHAHHEVIDLAGALADPANEDMYMDQGEEFKKAIKEMNEPLNVIAYPSHMAKDALSVDFYAMPNLTKRQAHWIVVKADKANKEFAPYVRDTLEEVEGDDLTRRPSEYFSKIKDTCHIRMNNEFMSRYHAVDSAPHGDGISDFSDVINDRSDYIDSKARSDTEFRKIRFVNSYYMDKYLKAWEKKFQEVRKDNRSFDISRIKDEHKGGWYERLRGTTSKEYKRFIKAFEEYHDPTSEHYLDKEYLTNKGNSYLRHKFKGEEVDLSKLSGTSLKRAKLVSDTLKVVAEERFIEDDIDKEIARGYPNEKEHFLEASDVEEIAPEKVKIKENGIEQVIETDIEFERIEL